VNPEPAGIYVLDGSGQLGVDGDFLALSVT
jgi:hypothetical protein